MKSLLKRLSLLSLTFAVAAVFVGCNNQKPAEKPVEVTEVEVIEETPKLVKESSMELEYAEYFKVDYYEGGYKVITDSDNREILLVPEGASIPELDRDMTIIQMPIDSVSISSTVDACWFRPINGLDKITGVTFEADKWDIEEIAKGLNDGDITYIGKISALDYEVVQAMDPDVFMLSASRSEEIIPKFEELGINYMVIGAYKEDDPRGRLEWVKFAGALLDKEEEAFSYYDNEIKTINALVEDIKASNMEKPKVANIYYSGSKELFRVTHGKGHTPVTVELAGGIHYPENYHMDVRGNSDMSNEDFYSIMQDVDIIIYDKASGHTIQNKEDLLATVPFVADLPVVTSNRIYMIKDHYWQSADKLSDIIASLHEIFSNPWGEVEETEYHYRIDKGM